MNKIFLLGGGGEGRRNFSYGFVKGCTKKTNFEYKGILNFNPKTDRTQRLDNKVVGSIIICICIYTSLDYPAPPRFFEK